MSVEEEIARIKAKAAKVAARVAVKVATLATLATGVGAVSGCVETNDRNTDENKDKIENVNVQEDKTSVVFRATHNSSKYGKSTDILLENGESFTVNGSFDDDFDDEGTFIEPGDTITYGPKKLGHSVVRTGIKAVRYKDGAGKDVNFGKIGKLEEGR